MNDILAEAFSLPFKTIPRELAKESETTGFLAREKIFYKIDRVTEFYELQRDDEYNLEYYLLIDRQNAPFIIYFTPTEETACAECTIEMDIFKQKKLWIRKDVKRNYGNNIIHIRTSGFIICLNCASDFISKWKRFDESLRNQTCEFCGNKFYFLRQLTLNNIIYKVCDSCLLTNFKFKGY